MSESNLWLVNYAGAAFTLCTSRKKFMQLENTWDESVTIKRLSSSHWCSWAIGHDHRVYIYVLSSDVPIRVAESTFENQRWSPLHGFSKNSLIITDRPAWSNESGTVDRPKESVRLPSAHWEWEADWFIDDNLRGEVVGIEGWQYAVDFPSVYTLESHWNSFVQRRKWLRFRHFSSTDVWARISDMEVVEKAECFIDISVGGFLMPSQPAGFLSVWTVTNNHHVYVRTDVTPDNPEGSSWQEIEISDHMGVINISVGASYIIWAITWDGNALVRTHVTRNNIYGSGWTEVKYPDDSTRLMQVSVGKNAVWAVSRKNEVWFRKGTSGDDMFWNAESAVGTSWVKMVGEMSHISVSCNDQVFAIDLTGMTVYFRTAVTRSDLTGRMWQPISLQEDLTAVAKAGFLTEGDICYCGDPDTPCALHSERRPRFSSTATSISSVSTATNAEDSGSDSFMPPLQQFPAHFTEPLINPDLHQLIDIDDQAFQSQNAISLHREPLLQVHAESCPNLISTFSDLDAEKLPLIKEGLVSIQQSVSMSTLTPTSQTSSAGSSTEESKIASAAIASTSLISEPVLEKVAVVTNILVEPSQLSNGQLSTKKTCDIDISKDGSENDSKYGTTCTEDKQQFSLLSDTTGLINQANLSANREVINSLGSNTNEEMNCRGAEQVISLGTLDDQKEDKAKEALFMPQKNIAFENVQLVRTECSNMITELMEVDRDLTKSGHSLLSLEATDGNEMCTICHVKTSTGNVGESSLLAGGSVTEQQYSSIINIALWEEGITNKEQAASIRVTPQKELYPLSDHTFNKESTEHESLSKNKEQTSEQKLKQDKIVYPRRKSSVPKERMPKIIDFSGSNMDDPIVYRPMPKKNHKKGKTVGRLNQSGNKNSKKNCDFKAVKLNVSANMVANTSLSDSFDEQEKSHDSKRHSEVPSCKRDESFVYVVDISSDLEKPGEMPTSVRKDESFVYVDETAVSEAVNLYPGEHNQNENDSRLFPPDISDTHVSIPDSSTGTTTIIIGTSVSSQDPEIDMDSTHEESDKWECVNTKPGSISPTHVVNQHNLTLDSVDYGFGLEHSSEWQQWSVQHCDMSSDTRLKDTSNVSLISNHIVIGKTTLDVQTIPLGSDDNVARQDQHDRPLQTGARNEDDENFIEIAELGDNRMNSLDMITASDDPCNFVTDLLTDDEGLDQAGSDKDMAVSVSSRETEAGSQMNISSDRSAGSNLLHAGKDSSGDEDSDDGQYSPFLGPGSSPDTKPRSSSQSEWKPFKQYKRPSACVTPTADVLSMSMMSVAQPRLCWKWLDATSCVIDDPSRVEWLANTHKEIKPKSRVVKISRHLRDDVMKKIQNRNRTEFHRFRNIEQAITRSTWVKKAIMHVFLYNRSNHWVSCSVELEQGISNVTEGCLTVHYEQKRQQKHTQVTLSEMTCVKASSDPDLPSGFTVYTAETNIIHQPLMLKASSENEAAEWIGYLCAANSTAWNMNRPIAPGAVWSCTFAGDIFVSATAEESQKPSNICWGQHGGHMSLVETGPSGVTWALGFDKMPYVYNNGYGGAVDAGVSEMSDNTQQITDFHRVFVYENQKWFPVVGWCCKGIFHHDFHWLTESGRSVPSKDAVKLPSSRWQWTSDWTVDFSTPGGVDTNGWQYSSNLSGPFYPRQHIRSSYRRRRWIRNCKITQLGPWRTAGSLGLIDVSVQIDPIASSDPVVVWAVGTNGDVLYRNGVIASNPLGQSWIHVATDSDKPFRSISVGGDYRVWGIASDGSVWFRPGVTPNNPAGKCWLQVINIPPGNSLLSQISAGATSVWAVDTGDNLWRRVNITPTYPEGTDWEWVANKVKKVSVGPRDQVWIIADAFFSKMKHGAGVIYQRLGISSEKPSGTDWEVVIGNGWAHVSVRGVSKFGESKPEETEKSGS